MRREIPSTEVKAKLSAILRQVERGHEYLITRNGKPVGLLSPPAADTSAADAAIASLRSIRADIQRRGKAMSTTEIVDLVREMRRKDE